MATGILAEPRSPAYRRARLAVLVIFALSRAIYFAAGLRFNTAPLNEFWQMVDLQLLRSDLWRSIWYLHMQPPGYNLAIGLVLKLFPVHFGAALWVLQMLCGVSIALNLLRLTTWMRIPLALSLGLTLFFVVSPATVLYENAAVYDYPMCALLLASATSLAGFVAEPRPSGAIAFFGWLTVLALIRNLIHVLYLLIVASLALAVFPKARKAVLVAAIPALLIVASVYVKNGVLFGRYTASTWEGMQLGRITTDQLTPAEAAGLIAGGTVSRFAAIPTFSPLAVYRPYLKRNYPGTGIPVLDRDVTSTGHSNFNALPYLEVHDQYAKDAKQVLLHKPVAFLRSFASGWFCYFRPSSDLNFYFGAETAPIDRWEKLFSAVVFGQFRRSDRHDEIKRLFFTGHPLAALSYTGVWLVILLPALTLWGILQFLVPSWRSHWTREQLILTGYLLLTILVLTFTVNVLSFQENNRYRFPLDPFFLTLLGMAMVRIRAAVRSAGARHERQTPVAIG